MTTHFRLFALTLLGLSMSLRAADVMVVYDASNSMWGQIEGRHKIEIAREVMGQVMTEWDEDTQVGLVAYGHRRKGDCSDIETVIPVGPLDREAFMETVNGIVPRGKTPLTAAVRHAAEALNFRDRPATVVLISDGIESCNAGPCASAEELERAGIRFTAHVIGFDVGDEADQAGLKCIADNTGGQFFAAADSAGLAEALGETSRLVAQPDPEVEVPEITLIAPETATVGSEIEIGWEGETEPRDLITVVSPDTPDEDYGRYRRVENQATVRLLMPGDVGTWQLRYRHQESGKIAARADIELVEASPELIAPESVSAGARLEFEWRDAVYPRDYITIVPAGTPEDEYGPYVRVGNKAGDALTVPGEPGDYLLRYHLDSDDRVVASVPVTVVEQGVTLEVADEIKAGAPFEFGWSESVHPRDYITIVPVGTPEDEYGPYVRVGDKSSDSLTAPGEAGDYVLRYHLDSDDRVLASEPVTVVEQDVSLTGPEEVGAGERFEFEWSGSIHPRDYITVVPVGTPEDEYGPYIRVGNNTRDSLTAPGEPGDYELRYHLDVDDRVMARHPLTITAQEVSISAPEEVTAGARFGVEWSNAIHPRDYVTIVPAGTPEDEYGPYVRVGNNASDSLVAPGEPGDYEVRYHLEVDDRVLASAPVTVTSADIEIEATESVTAGANFQVSWNQAIHPRDYVTVVPAGTPEDEYGPYQRVGNGTSARLQMPGEAGDYELRYHLEVDDRVMARRPIRATEPAVTLEAPDSVAAEEDVTIVFGEGVHPRDYITIVPADAPEDAYEDYRRVGGAERITLAAPATPGSYEIRYLLEVDDRVIARRDLVVE